MGGCALHFVPTSQATDSEKPPPPGSGGFSELPVAVDGRVRVQVIFVPCGAWNWRGWGGVGRGRGGAPGGAGRAAPGGPSTPSPARPELAGRHPGPEPPAPRRAAAPEGGKHLPRELLLQLPQALPGGLHVPQELGYLIVLGFGQLHASHRRACAAPAAAGGEGSGAAPLRAPARGRRPVTGGSGEGGGGGNPGGALCYKPGTGAVRGGRGRRFPQLRPAARPGRCGVGGEAGRAAIPRRSALRSRSGGRGERGAGRPPPRCAGKWRSLGGHRHPRDPRASRIGGLLPGLGGWRRALAASRLRRCPLLRPRSRLLLSRPGGREEVAAQGTSGAPSAPRHRRPRCPPG